LRIQFVGTFVKSPPSSHRSYVSLYGILVGYATKILKDNSYSEDIVQEAFIRFNAQMDKEEIKNPESYLKTVVRNLAIDHIRRQKRGLERIDSTIDIEAVLEKSSSQEQALASREELAIVLKALSSLPPTTQQIVKLHRFEGKKLQSIATKMGLSVSQTHFHLHKGLLHCMKALKKK